MDQFNKFVNSNFGKLKTNDYISGVLTLFLILYSGMAGPSLPEPITQLFDFAAFRVAVMALIIWTNNNNPALSVMLAVAFVIAMNTLSGKKLFEKFELLEPTSNILPGCLNIKFDDLLKIFDGDLPSLKQTLVHIGVPFNLPLTDENAPLLATHLINYGYKLSDSCKLPSNSIIN